MNLSGFSQFVKGVYSKIDEVIDETADLAPKFPTYGLWDIKQADSLVYRTRGVVGLNYLELVGDDEEMKKDEMYQGYQTEYTIQKEAHYVSISDMLSRTRLEELEEKLNAVKQLMIASYRTLDRWAWQVPANGFSTTDGSSNLPISRLDDSVSMYSTAHTSKVSGVSNRSNQVASNPVFSEANLFTAIKMLRDQLNGRGLGINWDGGIVLAVPTALHKSAYEALESQLRAESMDNDINYWKGVETDLISSTYLNNSVNSFTNADTSWYVFAKGAPYTGMKAVRLFDPEIVREVDFLTQQIRVGVQFGYAFGYSNFEYMVASDGSTS